MGFDLAATFLFGALVTGLVGLRLGPLWLRLAGVFLAAFAWVGVCQVALGAGWWWPVVGPILFNHDPMVYVSLLLVVLVWWGLKSTRAGLILRAVGENHGAAHALGYKVVRVRLMAIAFGGATAGLGGAYISLVRVPQWVEGLTAGAGWIALAIVVFASWRPWRILLGAYLFGGVTVLQLNLQAAGLAIPVEYLAMSPYVITIVVLVFISARGQHGAPGSLGRIFHANG